MSTLTCTLHHHIGDESDFERGLDVCSRVDAFEKQIDWLTRAYDIIDLSTVLSGKLPRRPLLLTFDDAFHSVLDVARSILAPRRLPAVYFINAGLLGSQSMSLDGTLAWAVSKVGIEQVCQAIGVRPRSHVGQIILQDMAKLGSTSRETVRRALVSQFGPPDMSARAPLLELKDLPELTRLGVEIGNHTLTHVHCRALVADEIRNEIAGNRARLEELSGSRVRSFSVPYGNEADLTPNILRTIRETGHEATFLVHARSNHRRPAADVWYRTSLHHEAPVELRRKLVHLPFIRTVRHFIGM